MTALITSYDPRADFGQGLLNRIAVLSTRIESRRRQLERCIRRLQQRDKPNSRFSR